MIGIIAAMEEEMEALGDLMESRETVRRAGLDFYRGEMAGQRAVVVCSGIGKVNAAMAAQLMIDLFRAEKLINTGVAGGLDPALCVGDIVLSTDALQYDVDVTAFGYPRGQIPRMEVYAFPTDETLRKLTVSLSKELLPPETVHQGRIVSGDAFVSEKERKEELFRVFQGSCVEMEGAAIAQVAYKNRIPCLILRSISDNADGSAAGDYDRFKQEAIHRTVKILTALMEDVKKL